MHISYIRIRNWKNFKEADARLGQRVFVIGPNASGKSNFLDIFRFLRDLADRGLKASVDEMRGGVSSLRCLAATRYSDIYVEVELSEGDKPLWRYVLEFNQDQATRPSVRQEVVTHEDKEVYRWAGSQESADPLLATQTALEQISLNKGFRDISNFFRSISYQHLLPQVVRDPRGFSATPVKDDPYGRDFLLRVLKTNEKQRKSRLAKIAAALQGAIPQLEDLDAEMDSSGVPHLVGRYRHWRPKGARQQETQFSDGTLRLFGLFWTVFEGAGTLLLEEPEISLHPEVVRRIPDLFYRINRERKTARQIIISTHSEDLLSDPGISAEEILRLEPSQDGTKIKLADDADKSAMKSGMTAAEVLLPKAAPANVAQFTFAFNDDR